jgi:hypothetical protein
LVLG